MKYLRRFDKRINYNSYATSAQDFPNVCFVEEDNEIIYNPLPEPLYIEAIEDLAISFNNTYEYSKDSGNTWYAGTSETSILATAGEKVYLRASELVVSDNNGIGTINVSNGTFNIGGYLTSMEKGADCNSVSLNTYQFSRLFKGNNGLISAKKLILPTNVKEYVFNELFMNCENMVAAPSAIELKYFRNSCCLRMFYGCSSLIEPPKLAMLYTTNVSRISGKHSFQYMFYGCTSLINAPDLPEINLEVSACYGMFQGCTSLVTPPSKVMMQGDMACDYMFRDCTSLIESPQIDIGYGSYDYMFYGCTNLSKIYWRDTEGPNGNMWVKGVSPTGVFVKREDVTWEYEFGDNAIPSGWTIETADA